MESENAHGLSATPGAMKGSRVEDTGDARQHLEHRLEIMARRQAR
jgi:hypothetical protein